ncbi:porin family protein [Myroides sp. DF42-4-2]|uniref:porin family protein n=1 Tax=unclassified Myroides TaxID=2642485 RepID=UPI0025792241|nr:porin family protein [Myroides sp. DF42-4-2]MDM1408882.1 PorT family protein [Myroides sp. DF42-4-2]
MKKLSLLFSIMLVALSFNSYAQSPINIGIKTGLNFTDFSSNPKVYSTKNSTGFGVGAMARINISRSYIQADLMYSEKSVKFEWAFGSDKATMKNIEIPVVYGYKLLKSPLYNLRVFGGGVYTAVLNNLSKGAVDNAFNEFDKSNIGYRVGAGVDILKFTVDVSYDGGLSNISKDFSSKPNTWFIAVGYKFL